MTSSRAFSSDEFFRYAAECRTLARLASRPQTGLDESAAKRRARSASMRLEAIANWLREQFFGHAETGLKWAVVRR